MPLSVVAIELLYEPKALKLGGLAYPRTLLKKPISEAALRKLLKHTHHDGATITDVAPAYVTAPLSERIASEKWQNKLLQTIWVARSCARNVEATRRKSAGY